METTIQDFAIIATVIIGYFISISLITTSFYKSRANNYLSLSLFLLASLIFIEWYGAVDMFWSFLVFMMLDLLIGVTLFTYFLIQLEHKYLKKSWYKWLYAPFICSFIVEAILHLDGIFHLYNSEFAGIVLYIKNEVSLVFNLFLSFWGRNLIQNSNTISADKKRWLLRLNFIIICFMLSWLLIRIEIFAFNTEYSTTIAPIILTFFSWWILYFGVFRLQIVVQKDEIHQHLELATKNTSDTETKKKLKGPTSSKIINQLYTLMDEEELFKNPLLSRFDLATRLGISEGYLSQIINQNINKSVIQFVNEYRIETAKNLLLNPVFNKYSVEAIGVEAGFKSKSAFYKVFKTSLEMSPGAYRKLQTS